MGGAVASVASPIVETVQAVVEPVTAETKQILDAAKKSLTSFQFGGGDVLGGAVDTAGNIVKKAGDVVVDAGKTVGDVATNIAKNPLPVIETVALTAAGVPPDVSSAIVTYANGGSLKDAAISYGAVNLGQAAADQFGAPAEYGTDVGSQQSQMLAQQEAGIPTVAKSTISGAASGATKAAAYGKSLGEGALKGGIVGGGSEYISESAGMQPGSTGEFLTKTLSGQTLSNIVGGSKSTSPSTAVPTSVTTTGAGASPGSSALAQALRTDLGAPIFGGDKDKESPKSGWNVESLRYMGNSGEA